MIRSTCIEIGKRRFRLNFGNQALADLLKRAWLSDFDPLELKEANDVDFVIGIYPTRGAPIPPLIQQPLLPLEGNKIHLRRERDLHGWALGDWLHLEDGEHFLDLNYQTGEARAFFSEAIFEQPKLLSHSYLLIAIIELLRTREVYFMHGAVAVDKRWRGILFLGDGGNGKSTSLFSLIRNGYRYVGDDTLLMWADEPGQVMVSTLLKRFMLHGTLMHRFPELVLSDLEPDGKGRVSEASLGAESRVESAPLSLAVILKIPPPGLRRLRSHFRPVTRSILLAELIKQNPLLFMQSHLAARHLEFLAHLCKQVQPFSLELGSDLLEQPNLLATILASYERLYAAEQFF